MARFYVITQCSNIDPDRNEVSMEPVIFLISPSVFCDVYFIYTKCNKVYVIVKLHEVKIKPNQINHFKFGNYLFFCTSVQLIFFSIILSARVTYYKIIVNVFTYDKCTDYPFYDPALLILSFFNFISLFLWWYVVFTSFYLLFIYNFLSMKINPHDMLWVL